MKCKRILFPGYLYSYEYMGAWWSPISPLEQICTAISGIGAATATANHRPQQYEVPRRTSALWGNPANPESIRRTRKGH